MRFKPPLLTLAVVAAILIFDFAASLIDIRYVADTPASLLLTLNGVAQNPGSGSPLTGADYTISGPTITYAVAPKATDFHHAWYSH